MTTPEEYERLADGIEGHGFVQYMTTRKEKDFIVSALRLAASATRQQEGATVKVRALEWEEAGRTTWLGHGIEPAQYSIRFDYTSASYWIPADMPADDEPGDEYLALDDAKAAAQADFERRVLACLDLGEPS